MPHVRRSRLTPSAMTGGGATHTAGDGATQTAMSHEDQRRSLTHAATAPGGGADPTPGGGAPALAVPFPASTTAPGATAAPSPLGVMDEMLAGSVPRSVREFAAAHCTHEPAGQSFRIMKPRHRARACSADNADRAVMQGWQGSTDRHVRQGGTKAMRQESERMCLNTQARTLPCVRDGRKRRREEDDLHLCRRG